MNIGILQGSARTNNNAAGIADWIKSIIEQQIPNSAVTLVDPQSSIHPPQHLTDPVIPALITPSDQYTDKNVQEWSKFILSLNSLIIVTPQYNWGYPSCVKAAIDCIYNEWKDLPVLLVTYGAHGGAKAGEQLREIIGSGIKAQLVSKNVEISLPTEYIRTEVRVQPGTAPEFLQQYKHRLERGIYELKNLMQSTSRHVVGTIVAGH